MNPIKIIDKVCGAGKTTWIFSEIDKRSEERWIYVSPYLSEVGDDGANGRIQNELPDMHFQSPSKKFSKQSDLKDLLHEGCNVAITHQLYLSMTKDMFEIIEQQEYNLVIDETLDLISLYNADNTDIELLLSKNIVSVEENGLVKWAHKSDYKGVFKEVKKLCDLEVLHLFNGQKGSDVFMCKLPPRLLTSCNQAYLLTYLFDGSIMDTWLKMHKIPYSYYDPEGLKDTKLIKKSVRKHLHILKTPRKIKEMHFNGYSTYKPYTFSKNWFKRNDEQMDTLSTALDSAVRNYFPRKKKVFYTTFKDYCEHVTKGSLRHAQYIFDDEELLIKTFSNTFVAKNQRASNEYADYNCAVHVCNTYPHVKIESYIELLGETIDRDKYALSEIVQWVFRGSIRKGEDMYVLVASMRMKGLLEEWLEEDW